MKRKYKLLLSAIFILFCFTLVITTGYGLWKSVEKSDKDTNAKTLDCFKVYYPNNSEYIEMSNIKPMLNENGLETSPYTLTISNACNTEKELQIRINILNDNTVDLNALTLVTSGNLESNIMPYKSLKNSKSVDPEVTISKLLGTIKINKEETIRTNIKLWFDEKKINSLEEGSILKAKIELVDAATSLKPNFSETIIANNYVNEAPVDFSIIGNGEGSFNKIANESEEYYYFRGNAQNNYVTFAGFSWRIVSISPNQNVKLILNDNIGVNNYSKYRNSIDYLGLQYIYNNANVNNNIMNELEKWYDENIEKKNLDKVVAETAYCNDSNFTEENYHKYFNAYNRLVSSKTPTYTCEETTQDFGGIYNQKIGLISADEVAMAGAVDGINNTSYYLYVPYDYYTLSPAEFYGYNAYIFYVNGAGALLRTYPTDRLNIRPVISLLSSVTVEGDGTIDNPYHLD